MFSLCNKTTMPSVVFVALVSFMTTGSVMAAQWDMPTPYGDGTHHTRNVRQFAEDVGEKTGDDLKIVVHSGASLIKHPEIYRAVRTGQVQIGEMFMGSLGNKNPIFKMDNIPFLASDFPSAKKLWAASKSSIEKTLAKDGLKLLYAVPWPPQGFYSKRPLSSGTDLAGLKMRAYSPTTSRLAILLKATPTTVQTPEIPQAFSTGIIDAMVTSPSTGVSSQSWDYVTNYTDTQAWIPKNMVFMNSRVFKRLDSETQKAVMKAAAQAELRGWKMAEEETISKTAILAEKGIQVASPSAKLRSDLQAIGKIMVREWAREAGSAGKDVLSAYQ